MVESSTGFTSEELDGDSAFLTLHCVDSQDLAKVLAAPRMWWRGVGQGHVDSHADEVLPQWCEEVDPTFGCILSLTDVLKIAVLKTGRPHLDGLAEFDSASMAAVNQGHEFIESYSQCVDHALVTKEFAFPGVLAVPVGATPHFDGGGQEDRAVFPAHDGQCDRVK